MREIDIKCDVLVAGGGLAGVCCALAAARNGARVVLCQDRPVLGGNASSEVRMHMVGADDGGKRGQALATEARESGIMEEIRLETCVRNPQRSASMFDLVLYEKCRNEPNLTLFLNTAVTGATVQNGRIVDALAERQSTEDSFRIRAGIYIDCTGDGRLGVEAGARYRRGREGREEYGERYAPLAADEKTLGSTLLFQARDMGCPVPFTAPVWAKKYTEEDLKLRPHAQAGVDRGLEYGYWWAEWGGELDTIKDNELIRDELLAIMLGVWDHIKNGGDHGAANWALDWFGFLPGKRESRRFEGQYILRESDLLSAHRFDDAIAYGGWSIDTHPPKGIEAVDEYPCRQTPVDHLYDIPLSACVSMNVENLMFAGRNISATHVAFASTRVMGTAGVIGQGVGTAAAVATRWNRTPMQLIRERELMQEVQQTLLRDDAYLVGVRNADALDMARQAVISASSEQLEGPATNIVSGQTRAVHGPNGAPPERAYAGTHRWLSDPAHGLPAWLELEWDDDIQPGEILVVFDTGLHRPLTLSHSDAYMEKMVWGRPQPETVKEYSIAAFIEGEWHVLAHETNNYQRLRVHCIVPTKAIQRLRLTVAATHGIAQAKICEVRVYE